MTPHFITVVVVFLIFILLLKNEFVIYFKFFCQKQSLLTSASCCFTSALSADIIFATFQNFIQHHLIKHFRQKFSFLMDSPSTAKIC